MPASPCDRRTGLLHAEGLHGDVALEGSQANIEVRDISDAHVHVQTLNGSVTLNNIRNGHVEITSVGGDVVLNSVSGPLVQVNSTSGKIHYEGDFGNSGEYMLDQPQRRHRGQRAQRCFDRCDRALGARQSGERFSARTQTHSLRGQGRECLRRYDEQGSIFGPVVFLQW